MKHKLIVATCFLCKKTSEHWAKREGVPQSRCISCRREYSKEYYHRTKDSQKEGRDSSRNRQRADRRAFLNSAKDKPCHDCGIKYPPYVMQFDHRDPMQKKFNISNGARGLEATALEIAKCDIVCANCHMERTHGKLQRRGKWRTRKDSNFQPDGS